MKKSISVIIGLLAVFLVNAQVVLKTIVTQGPVVAGESFQVQYVLEDKEGREAEFFQPDFKYFDFVSGPHMYNGIGYNADGPVKLKNITFTLRGVKEGKYVIPGASVKSQGQLIRSEAAPLEVISRATAIARGIIEERKAPREGSYLLPGEDPAEKMKMNIFMKVLVDRKSCYVGQPVTATFKLYSRLNSRSDIIKNPAFYGFAMQDMISLGDRVIDEEIVNGKKFQVHTIRKVQLYPLQAGMLTIDPMEVQNKVEFSTSTVSGKTEQEITEGVMPTEDELFSRPGFKYCENSMQSSEIRVKVNALPDTNKPAAFDGATGRFRIAARLEKQDLAVNEEGDLLITVSGKGNFMQVAPPAVSWPGNIEGFSPEVKDTLNKQASPLEGSRVFRYRFVSTKDGSYTIPAISFCFFDPDSNRYKTVTTQPVTVSINGALAKPALSSAEKKQGKGFSWILWAGAGLIVAMVVVTGLLRKRKQEKKPAPPVPGMISPKPVLPGVSELLQPAVILLEADDHRFYSVLRKAIWDFSSQRFDLSGSGMSKRNLVKTLQDYGIAETAREALLKILDACEAGLFTGAESSTDRQQLLDEARSVMLHIAEKK